MYLRCYNDILLTQPISAYGFVNLASITLNPEFTNIVMVGLGEMTVLVWLSFDQKLHGLTLAYLSTWSKFLPLVFLPPVLKVRALACL
jgi:hypothetical protein